MILAVPDPMFAACMTLSITSVCTTYEPELKPLGEPFEKTKTFPVLESTITGSIMGLLLTFRNWQPR